MRDLFFKTTKSKHPSSILRFVYAFLRVRKRVNFFGRTRRRNSAFFRMQILRKMFVWFYTDQFARRQVFRRLIRARSTSFRTFLNFCTTLELYVPVALYRFHFAVNMQEAFWLIRSRLVLKNGLIVTGKYQALSLGDILEVFFNRIFLLFGRRLLLRSLPRVRFTTSLRVVQIRWRLFWGCFGWNRRFFSFSRFPLRLARPGFRRNLLRRIRRYSQRVRKSFINVFTDYLFYRFFVKARRRFQLRLTYFLRQRQTLENYFFVCQKHGIAVFKNFFWYLPALVYFRVRRFRVRWGLGIYRPGRLKKKPVVKKVVRRKAKRQRRSKWLRLRRLAARRRRRRQFLRIVVKKFIFRRRRILRKRFLRFQFRYLRFYRSLKTKLWRFKKIRRRLKRGWAFNIVDVQSHHGSAGDMARLPMYFSISYFLEWRSYLIKRLRGLKQFYGAFRRGSCMRYLLFRRRIRLHIVRYRHRLRRRRKIKRLTLIFRRYARFRRLLKLRIFRKYWLRLAPPSLVKSKANPLFCPRQRAKKKKIRSRALLHLGKRQGFRGSLIQMVSNIKFFRILFTQSRSNNKRCRLLFFVRQLQNVAARVYWLGRLIEHRRHVLELRARYYYYDMFAGMSGSVVSDILIPQNCLHMLFGLTVNQLLRHKFVTNFYRVSLAVLRRKHLRFIAFFRKSFFGRIGFYRVLQSFILLMRWSIPRVSVKRRRLVSSQHRRRGLRKVTLFLAFLFSARRRSFLRKFRLNYPGRNSWAFLTARHRKQAARLFTFRKKQNSQRFLFLQDAFGNYFKRYRYKALYMKRPRWRRAIVRNRKLFERSSIVGFFNEFFHQRGVASYRLVVRAKRRRRRAWYRFRMGEGPRPVPLRRKSWSFRGRNQRRRSRSGYKPRRNYPYPVGGYWSAVDRANKK